MTNGHRTEVAMDTSMYIAVRLWLLVDVGITIGQEAAHVPG